MGEPGTRSEDRYVLISPCRDEADYIRETLESVAAQSQPPALWVVVDDGSTDDTQSILEEYLGRLPYLRVLRRENRGARAVGPGVIEAFYTGLESIDLGDFGYVCKLDVDLDLPPRYFELLLARMEANPRLGTCSGKPWYRHPTSGRMVPETCGDEMSVGMSKFYRTSCFREIGGFVREVMWDGIDCHRARMLGWSAEAFNDEELKFEHLRVQGSSDRGVLRGRARAGYGNYFMGTSPLYLLAIALNRLFEHPRVTGSFAMLWGYLASAIQRRPRYDDPQFRAFLRRYQHLALVSGKARAIETLHQETAHLWNARPTAGASERPSETAPKQERAAVSVGVAPPPASRSA